MQQSTVLKSLSNDVYNAAQRKVTLAQVVSTTLVDIVSQARYYALAMFGLANNIALPVTHVFFDQEGEQYEVKTIDGAVEVHLPTLLSTPSAGAHLLLLEVVGKILNPEMVGREQLRLSGFNWVNTFTGPLYHDYATKGESRDESFKNIGEYVYVYINNAHPNFTDHITSVDQFNGYWAVGLEEPAFSAAFLTSVMKVLFDDQDAKRFAAAYISLTSEATTGTQAFKQNSPEFIAQYMVLCLMD